MSEQPEKPYTVNNKPAAEIDLPRKVLELSGQLQERETGITLTISRNFEPYIKRMKGARLAVWLVLVLNMDGDGNAKIDLSEIEDKTGYSRQGVLDAVEALEFDGLLVVGRAHRTQNIYSPKMALSQESRVKKVESTLPISFNTINNNIDKLDSKKLTQNYPDWAIAAGVDYVPDPDLVALEQIHKDWDAIMHYSSWDKWGNFDKWLLAQQKSGRAVIDFCRWFMSDKFRAQTVGMYSPAGKREGTYSFKAMYPMAFSGSSNGVSEYRAALAAAGYTA